MLNPITRVRLPKLNWDDFRFFLALSEQRTLSGAARSLEVTHATMARRIQNLEAKVETVLFDQGPGGYQLTEKGQTIYDHVIQMREQIASIQAITENEEPEGVVRMSATPFLCDEIVTEFLPEFRQKFPHIDVEVIAENKNLSLSRHEAHLSLRLQRPETGEYVIRRVATLDYRLFKSTLLEGDEASAGVVAYTDDMSHIPESQWLETHLGRRRTALTTNALSCQLRAIEQGMGIGILPLYAARHSRSLIEIETEHALPRREIWLVMRRTLGSVLRVRILSDFLSAKFKAQRSVFSGPQDGQTSPTPFPDH